MLSHPGTLYLPSSAPGAPFHLMHFSLNTIPLIASLLLAFSSLFTILFFRMLVILTDAGSYTGMALVLPRYQGPIGVPRSTPALSDLPDCNRISGFMQCSPLPRSREKNWTRGPLNPHTVVCRSVNNGAIHTTVAPRSRLGRLTIILYNSRNLVAKRHLVLLSYDKHTIVISTVLYCTVLSP